MNKNIKCINCNNCTLLGEKDHIIGRCGLYLKIVKLHIVRDCKFYIDKEKLKDYIKEEAKK